MLAAVISLYVFGLETVVFLLGLHTKEKVPQDVYVRTYLHSGLHIIPYGTENQIDMDTQHAAE